MNDNLIKASATAVKFPVTDQTFTEISRTDRIKEAEEQNNTHKISKHGCIPPNIENSI